MIFQVAINHTREDYLAKSAQIQVADEATLFRAPLVQVDFCIQLRHHKDGADVEVLESSPRIANRIGSVTHELMVKPFTLSVYRQAELVIHRACVPARRLDVIMDPNGFHILVISTEPRERFIVETSNSGGRWFEAESEAERYAHEQHGAISRFVEDIAYEAKRHD